MDKKMIKYVGILIGLLVLLVVVLMLKNSISGGKKYSYEQIEELLVKKTKEYIDDNKKKDVNFLPTENGEEYTISSDRLVSNNYIKELSSYVKDETSCIGGVHIFNAGNGNYDYVPYLECGSKYNTSLLAERIIEDNNEGITYGSGLYVKVDGKFVTDENASYNGNSIEYVFRGDDVNNFLKIDDNIWRIVSIDDENNILVILESASQKSYAWDDKYNEEVNKYQGINIYEENGLESNAYKKVREFYDGELIVTNKEPYNSGKIKTLITPMTICSGKRSISDKSIDGSSECKVTLEEEYMSLLPAYYYMGASLDDGCDSITSKNCGNYNYLSQFDDYWWLLTANADTTNETYLVARKSVNSNLCNYKANIRPVIKLGARTVFKEGDGSKENPYQIKSYYE